MLSEPSLLAVLRAVQKPTKLSSPLDTKSYEFCCSAECPLLGVKQTVLGGIAMSAFDPKADMSRLELLLCNNKLDA